MFDRKKAKAAAKKDLKRNYWLLVFTCLIVAFFGISGSSSLLLTVAENLNADNESRSSVNGEGGNIFYEFANGNISLKLDGKNILADELEQAQKKFDENKQKSFKLGGLEVSYAEGEFAKVANMFATGSYINTIYKGMSKLTGSNEAAAVIVVVLSMVLRIVLTFFVLNVFAVISSRIFLESRIYGKIPLKRFFFLLRQKKWLHTAWVLLVREIFQSLWNLTVIGGVIKHYSYSMVPYIMAENPSMSARDAITLSRTMMKGHKFECFKLGMSFLGWIVVEALTLGVAGLFFTEPYKSAVYAEFYVSMREQAAAAELPNADMLNDEFLYRQATGEELARAYPDIEEMAERTAAFNDKYTGARAFFANVFGIVPSYSERTEAIDRNEVEKIKVSHFRDELDGQSYPTRLAVIPPSEGRDRLGTIFYTRSYSVTSLILMFFIGCFIGWVWEFIYKFIETGNFVNRGVLHGPWLPIYGSGAVMILVVLKKFRRSAVAEFFAAVVLCGIIEYFTAYLLELTHNGQKWWDYSGYFLNIHGRVCAEGLMVFGIGGVAFVYFGAPMLDNLIRRIKHKTAVVICAVLLTVFTADFIYSQINPNTGKGITDYADSRAADSAAESGIE